MTNHYENCKNAVVEDIIANLESIDILELYEIRKQINDRRPKTLEEFINQNYSEYSEGFRKDLDHEVRKLWLKLGPGCKDPKASFKIRDENLECMWDISICGTDPDVWVMEEGTSFNPIDIAQILFYIYIGKVVWR